ncbi:conserved Plasmodium protein, unknown function [Plasmodium knowlesi strain H]|uniref:Merozoite surface protein n=3 Tax=Plasmodium knowlesi TaxID=5850 RepID=A0A5K1V584_PLAKH|nr:merozoite surface protein, putative [Plasmodium knowlesi strain H]OTN67558.1 Uncharacterized protein PKNOH_S06432100 [Plasmodium knowlesi]CAA9987591.1 merozoite surface protein, putative [Plasmodium knowlesi strain H]SBO27013.1 conserved Plasmodium protein, unknown function [Plasmodium knowlesi strain H]SBO29228.1 conserved Plasmodium protein, unknown function [Plasmodium knowlesi strain H]VVS77065.1 merozoite surface protein, putative [Plasmodium knowlesi strain H]|eukprot:XP_002258593.1 hypothetical protein, conserved in Plasmodium species [Plasmodium knowlesi strain H]
MKLACALFFLLAVASNCGSHFFTFCSVDNSSVSQQTHRIPYLQRLSELIALSSYRELSDKRAEEKKNLRRKREDSYTPHIADDSSVNEEEVTIATINGEEKVKKTEKAEEDIESDYVGVPKEEDDSGKGISLDEEAGSIDYEHSMNAEAAGSIDYEHSVNAEAADSIDYEHSVNAEAADSIDYEHSMNAEAAGSIDYEHSVNAEAADSIDYEHSMNAEAAGSIDYEHSMNAEAAGSIDYEHSMNAETAGSIDYEHSMNAEAGASEGEEHTHKKFDGQSEDAFIRFFSPKSCITLPGEEASEKCKDVRGGNNSEYDIKVTYNEKEEHINRGENKCINLNINDGSPPSKDGPSNIFINLSLVPNIPEEIINDFYSIIKKLKTMFEIMEPEESNAQTEIIGSA